MSWFGLYVAVGIPALLVLMGLGLMWYDRWEERHDPR
jgi:hypothetical protein